MSESTLYPKIGRYDAVIKNILHLHGSQDGNIAPPTSVHLAGTVKLHGAHADIVVEADNRIRLQSRNIENLDINNDNYGFGRHMLPRQDALLKLKDRFLARYAELHLSLRLSASKPVIIAGEWIGHGIQKEVAIAQLTPRFVIVSAWVHGTWVPDQDYADIEDPDAGIYNISRGGVFEATLTLSDPIADIARIQTMVDAVERHCPFALSFGVSGTGEGIVWKVQDAPYQGNASYWFKSKGHLHAVSNIPTMRKELVGAAGKKESAALFAAAVVTETRLMQGLDYLEEMGVESNERGIGVFLKWMTADCLAEEKDALKEADVEVRMTKTEIIRVARVWYLKRI
ncbi:hypothetical protein LTR66_012101 [Elasticomyces elasticus]|nr:hypothetical protein LTR66_012101 [Elasticomyces elasticus]KAK5003992.1 hypothetical protein LTR28_009485 [Elasticomyces elasticus]